jgi:glycosyltransferase involved in cell wall biosynthesis
MTRLPFISIIIPAYNRAGMIVFTIESFISQTYPSDRFEIIVSDNNSTDNTKTVVMGLAATSLVPISYLFEARQGVHFARNEAAKLACGEILYFTDDDMIADKNLLTEIVKPFAIDNKIAAVTGTVLPKWEVPPPQWVVDLCMNGLLSLNIRREELLITCFDCGVYSCHQAVRRDVFFLTGGFNPENTAGEWIGDGETGLNLKIAALGYKFAFIGSSIIYHIIPQSRMTQQYLDKRYGNQGNCDSYTDFRKHEYDKTVLNKIITKHYFELFKTFLIYMTNRILAKKEWHISRAKLFYYLNRIKYDQRLLDDESWRILVLKNDWLHE